MKQITQFPRIPLAVAPTPLYKLEAISREYGKNIYIKRDDRRRAPMWCLPQEVRSRTMPCSLPRVPRSSV